MCLYKGQVKWRLNVLNTHFSVGADGAERRGGDAGHHHRRQHNQDRVGDLGVLQCGQRVNPCVTGVSKVCVRVIASRRVHDVLCVWSACVCNACGLHCLRGVCHDYPRGADDPAHAKEEHDAPDV